MKPFESWSNQPVSFCPENEECSLQIVSAKELINSLISEDTPSEFDDNVDDKSFFLLHISKGKFVEFINTINDEWCEIIKESYSDPCYLNDEMVANSCLTYSSMPSTEASFYYRKDDLNTAFLNSALHLSLCDDLRSPMDLKSQNGHLCSSPATTALHEPSELATISGLSHIQNDLEYNGGEKFSECSISPNISRCRNDINESVPICDNDCLSSCAYNTSHFAKEKNALDSAHPNCIAVNNVSEKYCNWKENVFCESDEMTEEVKSYQCEKETKCKPKVDLSDSTYSSICDIVIKTGQSNCKLKSSMPRKRENIKVSEDIKVIPSKDDLSNVSRSRKLKFPGSFFEEKDQHSPYDPPQPPDLNFISRNIQPTNSSLSTKPFFGDGNNKSTSNCFRNCSVSVETKSSHEVNKNVEDGTLHGAHPTTHQMLSVAPSCGKKSLKMAEANKSCSNSGTCSSVMTIVEEYLYTDCDKDIALVERRCPSLSSDAGWVSYSIGLYEYRSY